METTSGTDTTTATNHHHTKTTTGINNDHDCPNKKHKNNKNNKSNNKNNKKRRKRNEINESSFYNNVTFSTRISSGRPGTPHRYFASSYNVNVSMMTLKSSNTLPCNVVNATNSDAGNCSSSTTGNGNGNGNENVKDDNDITNDGCKLPSTETEFHIENYVVHSHVNGLCIMTVGDSIQQYILKLQQQQHQEQQNFMTTKEENRNTNNDVNNDDNKTNNQKIQFETQKEQNELKIKQVEYTVSTSKSQTVGQKRKEAKKMKRGNSKLFLNPKKGGTCVDGNDNNNNGSGGDGGGDGGGKSRGNGNNNGIVKPGDVVAKVTLSNGIVLYIHSCICGTVLEFNSNLEDNPSLLIDDPLLDGYLGVILPNGSFPPPASPTPIP